MPEPSRCAFFIGGSVCDVRADLGLLVALTVLFGFTNQRFWFFIGLQLHAERSRVGSVIPKHYLPRRVYLVYPNMSRIGQKSYALFILYYTVDISAGMLTNMVDILNIDHYID